MIVRHLQVLLNIFSRLDSSMTYKVPYPKQAFIGLFRIFGAKQFGPPTKLSGGLTQGEKWIIENGS